MRNMIFIVKLFSDGIDTQVYSVDGEGREVELAYEEAQQLCARALAHLDTVIHSDGMAEDIARILSIRPNFIRYEPSANYLAFSLGAFAFDDNILMAKHRWSSDPNNTEKMIGYAACKESIENIMTAYAFSGQVEWRN